MLNLRLPFRRRHVPAAPALVAVEVPLTILAPTPTEPSPVVTEPLFAETIVQRSTEPMPTDAKSAYDAALANLTNKANALAAAQAALAQAEADFVAAKGDFDARAAALLGKPAPVATPA
jgi:hypothetical protein